MSDSDLFMLAYGLIALGLLLLVAELLIPSAGILPVLSLTSLVVGSVLTFFYSTLLGVVTLVSLFIAVPLFGRLLLSVWPHTPMGKRMFLSGPEKDATVASMPVNLELEQLRGRFGRAVSALRPAGIVNFDGRRVDVITEGMLIEAGRWVRCVDVRAGTVVVREMDKPDLKDMESADWS